MRFALAWRLLSDATMNLARSFSLPCSVATALLGMLGCTTMESAPDAFIPDAHLRRDARLPERDASVGCASSPCLRWTRGPDLSSPTSDASAALLDVSGHPFVALIGGGNFLLDESGPFSATTAVASLEGASLGAFTSIGGPRALGFHNALVIEGQIYVFGGFDSRSYNERVFIGAPTLADSSISVAWTPSAAPAPTLSVGAGCVMLGEGAARRVYWMGGATESGVLRTVSVYDPATDTWSVGPSLPAARGYISALTYGGHAYVIGGINASNLAVPDVLVSTHDAAGALTGWQVATTLADAPWSSVAFVLETRAGAPYLFVAGGASGQTVTRTVLRAAIHPDGSLGDFVDAGTDMPSAIQRASALVHGNRAYVLGGKDQLRNRSTDLVFIGALEE